MMVALLTLELLAYAFGTVGAALLFLEFFQTPQYVKYDPERDNYRLKIRAESMAEYTTLGRLGAFLLAASFAALFLVRILNG